VAELKNVSLGSGELKGNQSTFLRGLLRGGNEVYARAAAYPSMGHDDKILEPLAPVKILGDVHPAVEAGR
jgi:hypothetical protein